MNGCMIKPKRDTWCGTIRHREHTQFVKPLAEAIILQCMEDCLDTEYRDDCLEFFSGERFSVCANLAGMDVVRQQKFRLFMNGILKHPSDHREEE